MTDLEKPEQVNSAEFKVHSGPFRLSLRFEADAFATLGHEIGARYVSVPKRPGETGGLLIGEIAQSNFDWIVTIQGITPVGIQYQFGPSYRLSSADKEVFRHLTDKEVFRYLAEDAESGGRPIGWYRSNTRPRHEPEEDDREISRTFFESEQNIFLFCDVAPDSRVHATCIILQPNGEEVAFPFDAGRFAAPEELRMSRREESGQPVAHETGSRDPRLTSPPLPIPQVEPAALPSPFAGLEEFPELLREQAAETGFEAPLTAPSPRPRREPIAVVSRRHTPRSYVSGANLRLTAALVAAGAIAYYARGRVPAPAAPPFLRPSSESPVAVVHPAGANAGDSLGLRAEYQGNSLLLGWDRTSARVNAATSGVFIIADGVKTRVLTLSPRELRNGGILYKPAADEINIELQIIEPRGRTASQSIRIVGAPEPVSPSAPIGQIARSVLRQPPPPRSATRGIRPARFEAPPLPSGVTEQRSITMLEEPEAPLIDPEAMTRPPWFASALMPLPPRPAPPTAQPGPTVERSDAQADVGARAPAFHAATAIHAPQPLVPQSVSFPQYAYDHRFEVKVEVSINQMGRVTEARLVDAIGPYASQLGPSALNTARAWTFRPATLGGQPVASTMVLTFRYSRPR
jgi:TonB family protein